MMAVGTRAAALLEDEVLLAAFSACRDGCVESWKAGATLEEREAAHAQLKALNEVAKQLRALAAQGRHIAAEIERRREAASASR